MAALSPHDVQVLNRVQALLASGGIAEANTEILSVSPAGSGHPDALFVAAELLRAQGRLSDARRALEGAVRLGPQNPHYWNALANLLNDAGEADEAIGAYRNAISLAPGNPEFRINLALCAASANRAQDAEVALDEAERLAPASARLWSVRGSLELAAGHAEQAARHFRRSLASDPEERIARHNLASALRQLDRPQDALEEIGVALSKGESRPETLTLRAHLLADTGRFDEAVAQYESVLADNPDYVDAHEMLARLLPQLGRKAEALAHYGTALQSLPGAYSLWQSAILAAKELGDADRLLDWSTAAIGRFGPDPEFSVAHAIGLGLGGRHGEAISKLKALADVHPDNVGISNHIVPSCLAVGDWAAAEHWASRSTELAPLDQSGWAWLSIIWRLRNDAREQWLADYERFAIPIELAPPPGYASQDEFLQRLEAVLTGLHVTQTEPGDQSLRNGTQTRGNLFDRRIDEIQALAHGLQLQIEDQLKALPVDPQHPFLGRIGQGRIAYAASWSVRLASSGFHINHVHPTGWLSSALYVSLPPEVARGQSLDGTLTFGVPDSSLGLELEPRRIIKPEAGTLVIFPSYFWHGTLPFESRDPRLTVAFDILPTDNQAGA